MADAAESKLSCAKCQKTSSAAWRTHKETKDCLCNQCYMKDNPWTAPPPGAEASSSTPSTKRRKILEVKSSGDPIAALAKEENDKARAATQVKKVEVKEEVKKEELSPKKQLKMDEGMKVAVKKEVTEVTEELAVDDSLNDIFADASKVKKKKRHGDSIMDHDNGPAPDESVESDNEVEKYGEVDEAGVPQCIIIESSSNPKLDGKYDRMPKPCRGRLCYFNRKNGKNGEKVVYLYWTKKWMIGAELGNGSTSFAKLKNVEALRDCCEPYPHAWQVYSKEADQEKGSHKTVVEMRVFDTATVGYLPQLPQPLLEVPSALARVASSGAAAAGAEPTMSQSPKKDKKNKNGTKADVKNEAKEVKEEIKEEVKEEVKEEPGPPSSDSESESESASSSAESEADGKQDGEDVVGDGTPGSPKKKSQAEIDEEKAAREKAREERKAAEAQEKKDVKARNFMDKLRDQVEQISDPHGRNQKIDLIKSMLQQRGPQLETAAGMTPEKCEDLMRSLEESFGSSRMPTTKGSKGTPAAAVKFEPTHRTAAKPRGVLKTRTPNEKRMDMRLSTVTENTAPLVEAVSILNYRSVGEALWFQQPGSIVTCDGCSRGVAQTMGALQGAPNQSQFAQFVFMCGDCMMTGRQPAVEEEKSDTQPKTW